MMNRGLWIALLLGAALTIGLAPAAYADGVALNQGEVLAGIGSGQIKHLTPTGTTLDTLNTTNGGSDSGMCFDTSLNVYATNFGTNRVAKFSKAGNLVTASFGSGYNALPESCVVDQAGNVYVGQAGGTHDVLKFNSSGTLVATFSPAVQDRGTDWIELAADQCTLSYTSEGPSVKRFNVCTNTQLPDFATLPKSPCFAQRFLPDGSELVACYGAVFRLNASGAVTKTYTIAGISAEFALNLDPDGTTFWTADVFTGAIARVDIASGAIVKTFTVPPNDFLAGLAIVGEPTAAGDPKITATGSAVNATEGKSFSGTVASFTDPDTTASASQYTASVSWGDGTTSAGTVSGSGGKFTVAGSHTYAEEGSYKVTITLTDADNKSNTATATGTAKVADAALSAKGVNAKSQSKFKGTVATFKDADPAGTKSDYSASINWGDGKTTNGNIAKNKVKGKKNKKFKFKVTGSHKYAHSGKFTVVVTIKDKGGATAKATSKLKIGNASVKLSGLPTSCETGGKHFLPVNLGVQGAGIKSVSVVLDGHSIAVTTVKSGSSYQAQFNLGLGNHDLRVAVTFNNGKVTNFHQTVSACETIPDPLSLF